MARLPRLALAGYPHLLLQRGHGSGPVFQDPGDYELYLTALQRAATEHRVAIHAYALLDDRVLLLATPQTDVGLGRMLQSLGRRFGAEVNRRRGRRGTLWDGRFKCTVLDAETRLLDCIRYVELAPAAAGQAQEALDQAWSSAAHHAGRRTDPLVTEHPLYWRLGNTPFEREARHRELLAEPLPRTLARQIEDALQKGWALGSEGFLKAVAASTDRPLTPRPRGRPRRAAPAE
ncbi:MAG TPA: transposase [Albitalea sp.]|nr:transposase [Albitalea sp.]